MRAVIYCTREYVTLPGYRGMISWSPLLMPLWNLSSQTTSEFQPPETSRRQIHNRLLYNERYLATTRGVWKGGARETCPPPEIPMLIKIRGFWLTHDCNGYYLLAYTSSASGWLRPQTPTRALPLDPAGGLLSPAPSFVPLRNKFLAMPLATTITKLALRE